MKYRVDQIWSLFACVYIATADNESEVPDDRVVATDEWSKSIVTLYIIISLIGFHAVAVIIE